MTVRRLHEEQPEDFVFTPENLAWAQKKLKNYPDGRQASAIIPLLWRAQEQHDGWLPEPAIRYVADMLGMPKIRALEVATFYTMFQLQPVGSVAHIQVCGTTPCMLRGSDDLMAICRERISKNQFEISENGKFSWEEVECAGACVNAPMIQVFKDTYEDLTAETFEKILDAFERGEKPEPGPQNGRQMSMAITGPTSLTDESLYAGTTNDNVPAETNPEDAAPIVREDFRPDVLSQARNGQPDDLKRIKGVGPKLEAMLHTLGFFHFDQVANWTDNNIAWVDANLEGFKGRVVRDNWVEQARALAAEKEA